MSMRASWRCCWPRPRADIPDGMSIPEELERRDERLKKLAEARTKIAARTQIAARAAGRLIREQAAHEGKVAARAATAKARGKKLGGRPPAPPAAGPGPADQINPTDADSRIMPVAGGGFAQCCNAPAVVTADRLLVAATDVVQAANDEQQGRAASRAMLGRPAAVPADLGRPQTMLADNGHFSAANAAACAAAGIEPLPALGRTRITHPWTGALPRRRRHRRTRRRSQPWCTAWRHHTARSSTPGASTPRNRGSASSNRFWASDNSCCAASTKSAASGAW